MDDISHLIFNFDVHGEYREDRRFVKMIVCIRGICCQEARVVLHSSGGGGGGQKWLICCWILMYFSYCMF